MSNNNDKGRHLAVEDKPKGWRRRLLGVPALAWAFMALGGVALAAWVFFIGATGTVSTANLSYTLTEANTASGDCVVTLVDGDTFNLAWADALGGDECAIRLGVTTPAANDDSLVFQGFNVTSTAGLVGYAPVASCGVAFPPGTNNGLVSFRLRVDPDASSPGDSFTLNPATDGVDLVPSGAYNAANCNTTP